jgi:hypothetical protein
VYGCPANFGQAKMGRSGRSWLVLSSRSLRVRWTLAPSDDVVGLDSRSDPAITPLLAGKQTPNLSPRE